MNTNVSGIPAPHRRKSATAREAVTAGTRSAHRSVRRCPGGARNGRKDLITSVVRRDGDVAVVETIGEIDVHTAGELRTILMALADEGRTHIVIDFAEVRFCDAAGLGALVAVNNRVRDAGGSLRLVRVRPAQRRIIRVARLDQLFRPYDSLDEALTP